VQEAIRAGVRKWGSHNGASRAFSSVRSNEEAEAKLAAWLGTEAALIYPSVTLANLGALPGLVGKRDLVVVDEHAHNSIQEGARLARPAGDRDRGPRLEVTQGDHHVVRLVEPDDRRRRRRRLGRHRLDIRRYCSANHLFVEPHFHIKVFDTASRRQAQPCGVVPLTTSVPTHSAHCVVQAVFLSEVVVPSEVAHCGAVAAPIQAAGFGQGHIE